MMMSSICPITVSNNLSDFLDLSSKHISGQWSTCMHRLHWDAMCTRNYVHFLVCGSHNCCFGFRM